MSERLKSWRVEQLKSWIVESALCRDACECVSSEKKYLKSSIVELLNYPTTPTPPYLRRGVFFTAWSSPPCEGGVRGGRAKTAPLWANLCRDACECVSSEQTRISHRSHNETSHRCHNETHLRWHNEISRRLNRLLRLNRYLWLRHCWLW